MSTGLSRGAEHELDFIASLIHHGYVWGSEHLLRDIWPYAEELGEHDDSYGDLFNFNVLISNNRCNEQRKSTRKRDAKIDTARIQSGIGGENYMINSNEYPPCPKCKRITYPTFDHQTRKPYLKCARAMVRSGREIGTGVDIPLCCKKPMEKAGSSYRAHARRDRYRCLICGSIKWM